MGSIALIIAVLAAGLEQLRPPALLRLDVGATKPEGWLLDELTLQAQGITGQLPYFWHFFNQSAWMGGKGSGGGAGQQYLPYYSNGLFPLSYQVDDANLRAIRDRYVGYILRHQNVTDSAGWLGPPIPPVTTITHNGPATSLVTKYWMVEALESHAEADPAAAGQVEAALVAHHRQMYDQLRAQTPPMNATKWGFGRYSDALVGIQWLLDRPEIASANSWLWDLLRLVRTESDAVMLNVTAAQGGGYSWQSWFESGDPFAYGDDGEVTGAVHLRRHGVDIGEAMKTGALWWRVDGLASDLQNPYTALEWGERFLHMSDGMYFADEEVTYQGSGPEPTGNHSHGHNAGRGTETCSVVETMFSMRTAYEITGNVTCKSAVRPIRADPGVSNTVAGARGTDGLNPLPYPFLLGPPPSSVPSPSAVQSWTGSNVWRSTHCRQRSGRTSRRTSTTTARTS